MKLARFDVGDGPMLGVVDGEAVGVLSGRLAGLPAGMIDLISRWDEFAAQAEAVRGKRDYALGEVRLLAPIRRPGKILAIGLNYADHVAEAGIARPEHQLWFTKAATAANGPYDPIQRPIASAALDYEAELVMVIGKGGRHIPRERAGAAVFGYCVGNDVSVRDWQMRSGQFMIGKSFDTHAPFGPWIVTSDELDPADLAIRSWVNGEKRQDSNTRHLIFDGPAQIEHVSQAMTLEAGDLIYTGTPGGVGMAMKPPRFLKAGDRVRVEIDGIGAIENPVVDETSPAR
jgi:2-keto-4-pentenoate hydratase/2-oxohepta-3-ene-1,7-dioic acid hydratase in catechol pathway